MENSILNPVEGFFNNKDVPNEIKAGALALMLKGTYSINSRANGNVKTFMSFVPCKNAVDTVAFDIGLPESMAKNNTQAVIAHIEPELAGVFDNQLEDEKVVEICAKSILSRTSVQLNDKALQGSSKAIENNMRDYFKIVREKAPNAVEPQAVEQMLNVMIEVYNSGVKKNQESIATKTA